MAALSRSVKLSNASPVVAAAAVASVAAAVVAAAVMAAASVRAVRVRRTVAAAVVAAAMAAVAAAVAVVTAAAAAAAAVVAGKHHADYLLTGTQFFWRNLVRGSAFSCVGRGLTGKEEQAGLSCVRKVDETLRGPLLQKSAPA